MVEVAEAWGGMTSLVELDAQVRGGKLTRQEAFGAGYSCLDISLTGHLDTYTCTYCI